MSRNEGKRERGPRPKVRPGGVIVLEDYRGNIDAALRDLKRETASAMSAAKRRRSFAPRDTHSARKRKGIERGRRREAYEAAGK